MLSKNKFGKQWILSRRTQWLCSKLRNVAAILLSLRQQFRSKLWNVAALLFLSRSEKSTQEWHVEARASQALTDERVLARAYNKHDFVLWRGVVSKSPYMRIKLLKFTWLRKLCDHALYHIVGRQPSRMLDFKGFTRAFALQQQSVIKLLALWLMLQLSLHISEICMRYYIQLPPWTLPLTIHCN